MPLAAAHRAADMRMFHFGTMRPAAPSRIPSLRDRPRGSVGAYALHVQCPWRLETANEILTGRLDLWEPVTQSDDFSFNEWDCEKDGNLQDLRVNEVLASTGMVVESVDAKPNGHFELTLGHQRSLTVFPSGSVSEDWRLFKPDTDEPHLVVSGGKIERDD
ncbi:MAG: hypothetical protein AAFU85_05015 [Planctomycetota bacterium]